MKKTIMLSALFLLVCYLNSCSTQNDNDSHKSGSKKKQSSCGCGQ